VRSIVQPLCIERETERCFNAGAESLGVSESQNTRVVDLSLDECSRVEVGLGTNFQGDTGGSGLGVVDSLGSSLNVRADAVVVASMECV